MLCYLLLVLLGFLLVFLSTLSGADWRVLFNGPPVDDGTAVRPARPAVPARGGRRDSGARV
jgi:hypothetical protein